MQSEGDQPPLSELGSFLTDSALVCFTIKICLIDSSHFGLVGILISQEGKASSINSAYNKFGSSNVDHRCRKRGNLIGIPRLSG